MHHPEGNDGENPSAQSLQQPFLNQHVNTNPADFDHALPIPDEPHAGHVNNSHIGHDQHDSIAQEPSTDIERLYETLKQKRKYHVLYLLINVLVLVAYIALPTLAVIYRETIIENEGQVCFLTCYPLGTTGTMVIVTAGFLFLVKFVLSLSGIIAYKKSLPNLIICLKYTYLIQIIPAFMYLDVIELLLNAFLFWEAANLEQIFIALREVILILEQQGIEYD